MYSSCPISDRKIDGNLARVCSAQIVFLSILLLITKLPIFALVLLYDFIIRALRLQYLSPIHFVGKFIVALLKIKPDMYNEAPKRFALFMGLSISFALSLLYLGNCILAGSILTLVLIACALLEAVFNYCIGCKIYQFIQLIK